MTMIDSHKYEQFFWVHTENEHPTQGTEYSNETDAIDAAEQSAKEVSDTVWFVTEIFERIVGRVKVEITFERE